MNLLIAERIIFSKLDTNPLKTYLFNKNSFHCIHSKSCLKKDVINRKWISPKNPNLVLKRDISFGKIRKIWRIIRLKDRGVAHNFKLDAINPKDNVLVYKAERNRITTFGGILFPLISIIGCIGVKFWVTFIDTEESDIDPHFKPNLIERHFIEFILLISIFHISLSKRYVLRIYFNKNNDLFSLSTWRWYWPLRTHTFQCKPGSAFESQSRFNQNILVQTFFGNTKIGKRRVFVSEEHFIYPIFYNILYGYSQTQELNQFKQDLSEHQNLIAEQLIKQKKMTNFS